MKKSYVPLIVILVILVLGAIIVMARDGDVVDETLTPPPIALTPPPAVMPPPPPAATPPAVNQTPPPSGTFSGEDDVQAGPDVMVHEITYDGSKYSPSSITIKQGDIVQFKNNSSGTFWPASDDHPQHKDYAGFDPAKAVAAGASWEFTFTKVGTWGFHDHIKPSATGTVTVTK